jgi:hypothetical protein
MILLSISLRETEEQTFLLLFSCVMDACCLLLLNSTSMQGRQNSGSYSRVAEGSSLRFVMPCDWARDSRRFKGTTIF